MRPINGAAVFLVFAWIPLGVAQTKADVPDGQSKAWVKHTKQGEFFVTENTSFDFVRLLNKNGEGYSWVLVSQTDHNEWSDSQEGVAGTISARAWKWPRTGKREVNWIFHAAGNAGRAFSDLGMFQVTTWPCCSSPFVNTYFSLWNGKLLYTTNGTPDGGHSGQDSGLLQVDGRYDGGRYSQTRFVGFGAAQSPNEIPTLQYGTDQAIKQSFFLRGHEYGDNFDVPKISITQDGKTLQNYLELNGQFDFDIVLQFDEVPEIRIPVENDVMRADKAVLPPGYSLTSETRK